MNVTSTKTAMLAIQPLTTSGKTRCTPNIVPCRVHHTGPTKVTKRYWAPTKDKDNAQTVHFRGRKLRGRAVKVPAGYEGLILQNSGKVLSQLANKKLVVQYDDEDEDEDGINHEDPGLPEEVKLLETVSTFDEILVWGHDQVPALDDPFVKNIAEWVSFAEAIHGGPQLSTSIEIQHNATENPSK